MSHRQPHLLDAERSAFIRALDGADVDLEEWEVDFVGGMLGRKFYSDRMRAQIDRLMNKYRGEITWEGKAPRLHPVRSQTREAYVPDEVTKLMQ